jgi:carboxymethylenebutenolidase
LTEGDRSAPGIPPTHKKVQLPTTSVVCVRGDRLYHEHIAWDQTCLLMQLGLMPKTLTVKDEKTGKTFEVKTPAYGEEAARKMLDKNSVASNGLFEGLINK